MRLLRLAMLLCAVAHPLFAQQHVEKLLLPVVVAQPVPGAFGSLWMTQTTFFNKGAAPLFVGGLLSCHFEPCLSFLPAQTMLTTPPAPPLGVAFGKFLYVDADRKSDLAVNLRVFDISRQATSFGTEVPTVPESEAEIGAVELLGVTATAPFRALVRVYDFDPNDTHFVSVRVLRPGSSADELISSTTLQLKSDPDTLDFPGFGQIDVSAIAPFEKVVRVEIVPVTPGLRFWAMANITNNDTQHVSLVTP